jgi:hypothetical protein
VRDVDEIAGKTGHFTDFSHRHLDQRISRGEQFIERAGLARSGCGGHDTTYRVARYLHNDLALPDEVGRRLLDRYNERLAQSGEEEWTPEELDHKWDSAVRARRIT